MENVESLYEAYHLRRLMLMLWSRANNVRSSNIVAAKVEDDIPDEHRGRYVLSFHTCDIMLTIRDGRKALDT